MDSVLVTNGITNLARQLTSLIHSINWNSVFFDVVYSNLELLQL